METQAGLLEVKRVIRLDGNGTVKAFCDVAIGGAYLVKGVRVVEGKKGIFVSLPREQGKDGRWYDTVAPMTKDARAPITSPSFRDVITSTAAVGWVTIGVVFRVMVFIAGADQTTIGRKAMFPMRVSFT